MHVKNVICSNSKIDLPQIGFFKRQRQRIYCWEMKNPKSGVKFAASFLCQSTWLSAPPPNLVRLPLLTHTQWNDSHLLHRNHNQQHVYLINLCSNYMDKVRDICHVRSGHCSRRNFRCVEILDVEKSIDV